MPRNSDELNRVLYAAQWNAQSLELSQASTEHLVVGLFSLPNSRTVFVLRQFGLAPKQTQLASGPNDGTIWPPPISQPEEVVLEIALDLDALAEKALRFASEEANLERSVEITPDHLVTGLLREPRGLGGVMLRMHSLTPDKWRKAVRG